MDADDLKFIATEPFGGPGEAAEIRVWQAVQSTFAQRECLGFWRYPIFPKNGDYRKEPDILVADQELGLIVIEVKSFSIDEVHAIRGHQWDTEYYGLTRSPYQQAERQLDALADFCDRQPGLRGQVAGRALVALPWITEEEWERKGFAALPSSPPILFKNQLGQQGLLLAIRGTTPLRAGHPLDDPSWRALMSVICGGPVLKKAAVTPPPPAGPVPPERQRRSEVIAALNEDLIQLDKQQVTIGMQLPPGPQRIRGVAGSGKTVLLCQKAAHMHVKHPDWDIALVFFTQSLYEQMISLVDKWVRHFSDGAMTYQPNNQKLRVMHAWGNRNRTGLYRTICGLYGRQSQPVVPGKSPGVGLAMRCRELLDDIRSQDRPGLYDAILIDEGQDLVVDGESHPEALFEAKQAIYWLAYSVLRIPDPAQPDLRRLIWAYDEAQSLDSLSIPNARSLFGDAGAQLLVGLYPGGIKKSDIMHRCYRTPGPILVAAQALGMGLLRPAGMLSGLTTADGWRKIGYEVEGTFLTGREVALRRPPANSPNRLPALWRGPIVGFQTFADRQAEAAAVAARIRENLDIDGLAPSRQILVVVLGFKWDADPVVQAVCQALRAQGINYYIPTALEPNAPPPEKGHEAARFWHDGAVTVSQTPRAKGNEADMVYVVGLDAVARQEGSIPLRNQIFVGFTRSKGWAFLSGVGAYPLYDEVRQVLDSGDTLRFTFRGSPRRDVETEDDRVMRLF
jgi:superfamily I DNA and RNA helicase